MGQKLDMRHHKGILSVLLLVLLIIAIVFGGYLSSSGGGPQTLQVMVFGLVFLLFVLAVLTISILIRTRDELHAMHEENRQRFLNVHEKITTAHAAVAKKEARK